MGFAPLNVIENFLYLAKEEINPSEEACDYIPPSGRDPKNHSHIMRGQPRVLIRTGVVMDHVCRTVDDVRTMTESLDTVEMDLRYQRQSDGRWDNNGRHQLVKESMYESAIVMCERHSCQIEGSKR